MIHQLVYYSRNTVPGDGRGLPPYGGPGSKLVHRRSEGPPDLGPAER